VALFRNNRPWEVRLKANCRADKLRGWYVTLGQSEGGCFQGLSGDVISIKYMHFKNFLLYAQIFEFSGKNQDYVRNCSNQIAKDISPPGEATSIISRLRLSID